MKKAPGVDSLDLHGPEYVLAALGARTPEPAPGKSVFRILFLPSFHPECLLTVTDEGGTGTIELLSGRHRKQRIESAAIRRTSQPQEWTA